MSKKKKELIQAAGAIFLSRNTQRYLFLLRDDDTHTNTWGLVGGRVEDKESVYDALKREIVEEVGFLPTIEKTIPVDLYSSSDGRFEYHTFVCVIESEFIPTLNHEHKGYCWTTLDGVPKPTHPALHNALAVVELQNKLETLNTIYN